MLKLGKNVKIFVVRYFHTIRKQNKRAQLKRIFYRFSQDKVLGKYLLFTNVVSSGVLMAAGDGIQQQIEFYKKTHKGQNYDWNRTMNMTVVGLSLGPLQHFFYQYVDYIFPKSTIKSVVKKILLDIIVASPVSVSVFFYGLGFLEGGSLRNAHKELENKFLTIYLVDWMIWPPTQYFNFTYLSANYRVLYTNFITMFHDIFLSYVKHNNKEFHYSLLLAQLHRSWQPFLVSELASSSSRACMQFY